METVWRENRTEWTSVMTRYGLFLSSVYYSAYFLTSSFFLKFFPSSFLPLRVDMETTQK